MDYATLAECLFFESLVTRRDCERRAKLFLITDEVAEVVGVEIDRHGAQVMVFAIASTKLSHLIER